MLQVAVNHRRLLRVQVLHGLARRVVHGPHLVFGQRPALLQPPLNQRVHRASTAVLEQQQRLLGRHLRRHQLHHGPVPRNVLQKLHLALGRLCPLLVGQQDTFERVHLSALVRHLVHKREASLARTVRKQTRSSPPRTSPCFSSTWYWLRLTVMKVGCWVLFESVTALLTLLNVDEANCFTLLKYSSIHTLMSLLHTHTLHQPWCDTRETFFVYSRARGLRCGHGLRQSVWCADAW